MDNMDSPSDSWWLVSLRIASSSLSEEPMALEDYGMTTRAPKLIEKQEKKKASRASASREEKKER